MAVHAAATSSCQASPPQQCKMDPDVSTAPPHLSSLSSTPCMALRGCLFDPLRPPLVAAPDMFGPGMLVDKLSNGLPQHSSTDGGIAKPAHHNVWSQSLLNYLPRKNGKQGQGSTKPEMAWHGSKQSQG